MSATAHYLAALEDRFEREVLARSALAAQVQSLATQLAALQSASGGGGNQGGGGGVIYSMVGVVIAANSNVTGVTVNAFVGGSTVALPGTYTVYNQMQAATVVTKTIMLGKNPDGTFSAISQSC